MRSFEGGARVVAAEAPATLTADTWQRFRRNRLALVGLVVVAFLAVAAAGAPWLAPADPAKQSLIEKRARPSEKFLLGADDFGRDILSPLIYGSPGALLVGLLSL